VLKDAKFGIDIGVGSVLLLKEVQKLHQNLGFNVY